MKHSSKIHEGSGCAVFVPIHESFQLMANAYEVEFLSRLWQALVAV
jgi:hypothetical protein